MPKLVRIQSSPRGGGTYVSGQVDQCRYGDQKGEGTFLLVNFICLFFRQYNSESNIFYRFDQSHLSKPVCPPKLKIRVPKYIYSVLWIVQVVQ